MLKRTAGGEQVEDGAFGAAVGEENGVAEFPQPLPRPGEGGKRS